MNLYEILGVNNHATKKDIRKAYHKLIFKYHPDRNHDDKMYCEDYVKKINLAYEILYDDKKRKEYDELNITNENEFNYFFNNLLNKIKLTTIEDIFNNFKKLFIDSDHDYIYKKDYITLDNDNDNDIIISDYDSIELNDNDITGELYIDLKHIYNGYGKKITITRKTKKGNNDKEFIIHLIYDRVIINNEGDEDINGNKGKIILKIVSINNGDYERYNTNDLIIKKNISLYEYIYGIYHEFQHLDNSNINIKIDKPIYELIHEKDKLIYKIKNKGLLISSNNNIRGDLYIHYIIQVPHNSQELLSKFFN
jgi:DnaJ-class molecular chaperone